MPKGEKKSYKSGFAWTIKDFCSPDWLKVTAFYHFLKLKIVWLQEKQGFMCVVSWLPLPSILLICDARQAHDDTDP